jgi:hypothetical protein
MLPAARLGPRVGWQRAGLAALLIPGVLWVRVRDCDVCSAGRRAARRSGIMEEDVYDLCLNYEFYDASPV